MAEKKEAPAVEAPPKGGKGKLIAIVAVAGVLLLGGGGAGAWLLLGKKNADQPGAEAKIAPRKMPVFVDLDMFTVNLKDKDDERLMQVKLVAEVKDTPSGEMLKTLMPSVRNEILLLLGSKQAGEVATREGKEKLAQEIVASANKVLEGTPAAKSVEGVNFTHLIVQ
ncbi:MAG: flagellar basal body-associated FliL family protein [Burkholderiaceae bacterium]|nr:flagellar basal body-associated FliL family protein [Burkholderiaceae bacterium]